MHVIAGPEFGNLQNHVLVTHKALCGLRSSGLRWHERFSDCLREMGFSACKAEPDMWMRPTGGACEHIAVCVDDLAIAARDPKDIVDTLMNKCNFKLKGTGQISYHLGMDFFRDEEGVLCFAPKKYVQKMMDSHVRMCGSKPVQNVSSPLEHGDHPELDDSDFLNDEEAQKYQSMVGSMQWAISIGRIDITTAVMTLSSFRSQPRQGHLDRAKRLHGCLCKFKDAVMRIRTDEPDYSDLPEKHYDWAHSVCGDGKELIPEDAPEPLGNFVTLTHCVDVNLCHDMLTGKSVTGALHFVNKTPIDWCSKKQATVETATHGSEFVAARTCVEQILDVRLTL